MRLFRLCLILLIMTSPALAVDWKSLGKPLTDDTKSMYDRYVYFDGNTTDKNIGIDKPVLLNDEIQAWIAQRAAEVMTLDGAHYEQQIAVNRRHFTPKGYGEYVASLDAAQIPKLLKEQRYKMSAVVIDPGNVFAKGLRDENEADKDKPDHKAKLVYIWQIEVPITLNYQNLNGTNSYKIYLTAELKRIPMQTDNENTLVAINGWRFAQKPRQAL